LVIQPIFIAEDVCSLGRVAVLLHWDVVLFLVAQSYVQNEEVLVLLLLSLQKARTILIFRFRTVMLGAL